MDSCWLPDAQRLVSALRYRISHGYGRARTSIVILYLIAC